MDWIQDTVTTPPIPGALIYRKKGFVVLVTEEPPVGLHLSISHKAMYPGWDDIKDAVYSLLPGDRTYAMYFPPKDQFVNLHPNCFHVWETKENHEVAI